MKIKIKKFLRGVTVNEIRNRGAIIGENVEIWTNKIDKRHAFLFEIGNHVITIDARILLHDASTKMLLRYSKVTTVKIGSNVFVGADSIILPGVTIINDLIIGADVVVTKSIPSD